jgi:hypothetical protein
LNEIAPPPRQLNRYRAGPKMKKYCLFAALSGCAWAIIAYVLSYGMFNANTVIGGIVISPLIGLVIGLVFLPAYRLPKFVQFALSLVSLYFAVALFGLGVGVYDAARDVPDRIGTTEVVLQTVIASWFGVTMGYVLVLWPLAFLNHRLLHRVYPDAR